ncbi:MAG: beta-aspartyl-peptidase [Eubacteriales bacterium]
MVTLIKNADVYAPKYLGKKDVLLAGDKIEKIDDNIEISGNFDFELIDANDKYLFPGFIDCHVHITGGGGEGGFATRTPEIELKDIIDGGITTIVGTLGTDGYGRSMPELLAKAASLTAAGITTYTYTGSYQIPVRTFTGSISKDIMFIDKIVGVGEIAVSDHRSSCPSVHELEQIVSETRVSGMLSGKRGVVNIHIGDEPEVLEKIKAITKYCKAYLKHFHPTHMNRSRTVFDDGLEYLKMGGSIDFTTSTTPQFLQEGEIACVDAVKEVIDKGLNISKVTLSSDGQGSLPLFDEKGNFLGVDVGRVTSIYETVRSCIEAGVPVETAVSLATANTADIFDWTHKGRVIEGADSDVVLVNKQSMAIDTVIAKGEILRKNERNLRKGAFER